MVLIKNLTQTQINGISSNLKGEVITNTDANKLMYNTGSEFTYLVYSDLSGSVSGLASVTATNLTGTLQTTAQPNVTSVGTLTGLTSNGNVNISEHDGSTTGLQLNGTLITATAEKLNYVDTTPGTAQANKALILDENLSIVGLSNLETDNLTVNGTLVTASAIELNYVDITTLGTAQANKALVVDANKNIVGINNLEANYIVVNGTLVTSSAIELNYVDVTALGTAEANKALVVDANRDISNIRNLGADNLTGTLQTAAQPNVTSVGTLTGLNVTGSTVLESLTVAGVPLNSFNTGGLKLRVYSGTEFNGRVIKADVSTSINFTDYEPATGVTENYSMEVWGYIKPQFTESYTFTVSSNDNFRLWINNELVRVGWASGDQNNLQTSPISLIADTWYPIYIQHVQLTSSEKLSLLWNSTSQVSELVPGVAMAYDDKIINVSARTTYFQDSINLYDNTNSNISTIGVNAFGDLNLNSFSKNVNISGHDGSTMGLKLNGTLVTSTAIELNYVDVTPGTASASKALVLDVNKDISGINNLSVAGTLSMGGSLSLSSTDDVVDENDGGAFTSSGGGAFAKSVHIGNDLHVLDNSYLQGNVSITGPSLIIPTGNTASRPSPAADGQVRYNSETQQFEGFGAGATWGSLGGVVNVEQTTKILAELSPGSGDNNLRFITDNTERLRIGAVGKIGINTSNPDKQLEINSSSGEVLRLTYDDNNGGSTNYADFNISSGGNLNIKSSGLTTLIDSTNNFDIVGHNASSLGLKLAGVLVTSTATELNYVDTTQGIAEASKALVLNASRDISNINILSSAKGAFVDTTDSTSTTTGALVVAGGVGIAKKLNVGSLDKSTSPTTGALVVSGGVGINDSLYVNKSTHIIGTGLETIGGMGGWTAKAASEANSWKSICWSPELMLFVAVANSGVNRVMISTDGITWTAQDIPEDNNVYSICWSPELMLFVAITANGTNRIMTSPNGINWTARAAPEDNSWVSICWSSELMLFVAVAQNGTNRIMTSSNGTIWAARAAPGDNSWTSICWSTELNLFVAIAQSGTNRVMTSLDGITWTARITSEANPWSSICWSPELMLFVAIAYGGTKRIMTSPDGITWTAIVATEANSWTSICWSPELMLFVAVAASGTNRVMTSLNGITWTASTASEANGWMNVCWSPELMTFAAVSTDGTNRVMISKAVIGEHKSALVVTGKTDVSDALTVGGITKFTNTGDASSSTTGSLIASGGVGIAKKLYVGDGIYGTLQTAAQPTITSVGTLTSLGVTGNIECAGNLVIDGTSISKSEILVLDDAIPGTASALKAMITDSNNSIGSINSFNSATLDVTAHDGTTQGLKLGGVLLTATANQINSIFGAGGEGKFNNLTVNTQLTLGETPITATGTELNYVDTTQGVAEASKALILNSDRNISNINALSVASGTFIDTTDSTSTITGALTVAGGVGIAKKLNVGGSTAITDVTASTSSTTGALTVAGGVGIDGALFVKSTTSVTGATTLNNTLDVTGATTLNSTLEVTDTTILNSTLDVTDATTLNSTLGVSGDTNIAGIASITNSTTSTSTDTGALVVTGGTGIGGALNVDGVTKILNTTASTSATTGALTVSGGVGINDSLYVNKSTYIAGTGLGAVNSSGEWYGQIASSTSPWYSVCWSPQLMLFVAVAENGTNFIMTSPDGVTWNSQTASSDGAWKSICWSPELMLFVAVANNWDNRVMTSPNGINWTSQVASVQNAWNSVCWSPELMLFVAVATDGTNRVMTSPDGITWTSRTASVNNEWNSVCWSPELSLFVAVSGDGFNRVMTSPDGIIWTTQVASGTSQSVTETTSFKSVCWSPELMLFVAVGNVGTNFVITSPDGINWTSIYINVNSGWHSVCWSPELMLFVAVSYEGMYRVITSPDGTNWTPMAASENNSWYSVCWSPELMTFAAVSSNGDNRVMIYQPGAESSGNALVVIGNTDVSNALTVGGVTKFTNIDDASSSTTGSLIASGGVGIAKKLYVGDGIYGTLETKAQPNIETVNILDVTEHDGTTQGLKLGGVLLTATANQINSIFGDGGEGKFNNLTVNTQLTLGETPITATGTELNYVDTTQGVAEASKALVLNASRDISNINVLSSAKGAFIDTTDSTSPSTGSLVVAGGVGIAKKLNVGSLDNSTSITTGAMTVAGGVGISKTLTVGSATHIKGAGLSVIGSQGGSAWVARSATEANPWYSVCWSPELMIFVAIAGDGINKIMTSPDGITWTARTILLNNMYDICWSSELLLFVAVGMDSDVVLTSSDGITWVTKSLPSYGAWYSICWSPEMMLFVAVAIDGSNRIATSPDGTTWTARSAPGTNPWYDVCWSAELMLFVAVADSGTDRVITSPDGITWTARVASEANGWVSVCWSAELMLFVAVANSGTNRVMTSLDGITWTARVASELNSWRSICWSPELMLFVAVANSGTNRVMTSPDGTTWTAVVASEANSWRSICWSPELMTFVAVANNGTNRVMTSQHIIGETNSALVVTGKTEVSDALTVGGVTKFTNITDSASPITGSLIASGGVGIAKKLYVGDGIYGTLETKAQPNIESVTTLDVTAHDGTTQGLKLGGVLLTATANQINSIFGDGGEGKFNNLTVNTQLTLGETPITATGIELNYVDTTQGIAEASKALILDSNKDIENINSLTAITLNTTHLITDDLATATLNTTGNVGINTSDLTFGLQVNESDGNVLRLTYNDNTSATPVSNSDFTMNSSGKLTITTQGSTNIATHNGSSLGLELAGILVTSTADELNYVNVTQGVATASKALVLDSLLDINGINSLTATSLTGTLQTALQPNVTSVGTLTSLVSDGNVNIAEHNGIDVGLKLANVLVTSSAKQLNYVNVTPGSASPSKALVLDSDSNITGINSLSMNNLNLSYDSAVNNTSGYPLSITRVTNGTPANGLGVGMSFLVENSTNSNVEFGNVNVVSSDITASSETGQFIVNLMANGVMTEALRVDSTTIYATQLYETSDRRVKENIIDVSLEETHDRVMSLHLVDYNYIGENASLVHRGLIAQEIQEVIPVAVNESKKDNIEDFKSVSNREVTNHLIGSVQYLSKKLDEMMQKYEKLSSEFDEYKKNNM